MATAIAEGKKAPDFTLADAGGKQVSLSDFKGKDVVVYFYPKDDTPGCTKEACGFRDLNKELQKAGVVVLGVSADSGESHTKFAQKYRLPFTLLSDRDGAVRRQFGVPATLGLLPGRVTYVIDQGGTVRHVFNSQFQAAQHVAEAIGALRTSH